MTERLIAANWVCIAACAVTAAVYRDPLTLLVIPASVSALVSLYTSRAAE